MPKILVTGNGFDLNLGLPTSYNDFMNILGAVENNPINFERIYSNCLNYEKIKSDYKPFDLDIEKIEELRKHILSNSWYVFFKEEFEIETWIDFENKIEYVLEILFTATKILNEKVFSKHSISNNSLNYRESLFDSNIEIMQVLKIFKVIFINNEINNVRLNNKLLIKKYNFYTDLDLSKINKELYKELIDFKKIFSIYFEIFIYPFYENLNFKIDRTQFQMIDKHYTFNFTPTFEKIFRKNNITNFLHGKIDSTSNQIVLGINEIPNNVNDKKDFLSFTKYFQKLNNNTDYKFLKDFEKKVNSNFMFFIFGHSLDKSDEDYINEIFDFVNELKSKIKKILIIYHNEDSKSKLLLNLLDIRGKDDIQELMRSEILIFTKIDSKELIKELKRDITPATLKIYT